MPLRHSVKVGIRSARELKVHCGEKLGFDDYKQCLLAGRKAFQKQLLFQNKLHEVHMVEVSTFALSRNDDK